jgi:hypothetical protein
MKSMNLFIVTVICSLNLFASVSETADVNLQAKETALTISTTTEKSIGSNKDCVPAYSAMNEAADYVNTQKNAVKIMDIIYLNAAEAASCPVQFDLKVLVRYYTK